MENVSAVTSFIFTAYTELEDNRNFYFVSILLTYILIFFINSFLIFIIYSEKGLHEPMYLFICNLSLNSMYGSSVFLPSILGHLFSQNYEVSVARCLLQTYCLYVSGIIEFTTLAVMAYDRYVAICHPLHYHLLMSPRQTYTAIALCWVVPCTYFALYFISTARLSFCVKHIDKLYCSNFHLQTLSCFDTSVENFVGMALIAVCPGLPFFLILFSYAQILRICLFASKESQMKALQTCTPHLLTVMNYSVGVLFELVHSSFDMSYVPFKARIFMSLFFWLIPPFFNPLVYGVAIRAIRIQIFKVLAGK